VLVPPAAAQRPVRPISVEAHAEDQLSFIRRTMERSSTFTAVSGWGGVGMGVIAIAAATAGARQPTAERWLAAWLAAAIVAFVLGIVAMRRKAARVGVPLNGAPGRRFAIGLLAPLTAGAALTAGLWLQNAWALMAPTWLLLYGAGVITGGAFSVAPMQPLGFAFMGLGGLALVTPPSWGNMWLAVGFGGLQIGFGVYIARKHGG
jgi:hypothetical protein